MEKLPENASETERVNFTMAMVRRALDDRNEDYWFYSNNSTVLIEKNDIECSLKIKPGKVIFNNWGEDDNRPDVTYTDEIVGKSKYMMAIKRYHVEELIDHYTGEPYSIEVCQDVLIGELQVENRTDSDYLKTFGDSLEEMIDEIRYYFNLLTDDNPENLQM